MKLTRILLYSFAIMTLAACQPAQPTQLVATSQAQSTSAQPSGQPPSNQGSGGVCDNLYWPAVEGAAWTSNWHDSVNGDSTQVDTITDVGSDAFLVETTRSDGTDYVITWTCTPEGLLWLQTNGGQFAAVFPDMQWSTNSYSGVSIPKQIQPGNRWSSSESLTAIGSAGSFNFHANLDFHAVGVESVTVPAGTFNAMRVDIVMVFSGQVSGQDFETTTNISDWVAEGVGLVKSVATGENGGVGWEQELVSYSIP